jgi:hypothetical protein
LSRAFNFNEENSVRYNASGSEWNFGIKEDEFYQIIKTYGNHPDLRRKINLEYSALDGGKKYYFSLVQKFIPSNNQWVDIEVN